MSLAKSNRALGAVTRLLKGRLTTWVTGANVTTNRPELAATAGGNPKLNLFLYETNFDGSLRNVPLDESRPTPLWLVLKYLLTAFDTSGDSDTPEAHELLGRGISALQELAYLPISSASATDQEALHKNPEPLKITFDDVTAELISKLMQGSDEKYRLSVGFQVRPVMIAPPEPASYGLLVGIDYTIPNPPPANIIGEKGIVVDVLPSLGINLDQVKPAKFEVNSTFSLTGTDLNLSGIEVVLESTALIIAPPITAAELKCTTSGTAIAGGMVMSAGSHPLFVRKTLPGGRRRSSNLLVGNLLPTLTAATPGGLVNLIDGRVRGNLQITGQLLGTANDDVLVAFYRNGTVERMFDAGDPGVVTASHMIMNATQTQLDLTVADAQALPPGNYRVILCVNGQQARSSPEVAWV